MSSWNGFNTSGDVNQSAGREVDTHPQKSRKGLLHLLWYWGGPGKEPIRWTAPDLDGEFEVTARHANFRGREVTCHPQGAEIVRCLSAWAICQEVGNPQLNPALLVRIVRLQVVPVACATVTI